MEIVQSALKIVQYPHPALRYQARALTAIDGKVRRYAEEMLALMYANRGLGLAATQVALPYRLFVMNIESDPEKKELEGVYINPVIMERRGTIEGDEGCLSFPDLYQKVRRAKTVKVQAYDLEGKVVEILTSELPPEIAELSSRVLQHEIDHLHGVLFIDKMGPLGKLAARGTLREFEREFRKAQEKGEYPSDAEIEKRLREQAEGNGTAPIM